MNRSHLLICAALTFVGVSGAAGVAQAAKGGAKLLLQDLKAEGVEAHEASALSTAACHALAEYPKYDVMCGDDLRSMMQFGALAASFDGCSDETCYAGIAKALDARFVVSGKVTKLGKLYVLTLSMFDTKTNKPAGRTEIKADALEKLHLDTKEAVSALLKP